MVKITEEGAANQPRGNKRQFPNSNAGFNNNQGGRNPRGDQGNNPAKFGRQNYGDRSPFNRGNNRNFNQWNKGGGNDRQNNRGPRNFNGRQNFNPKPWQQKNANFQPRDGEQATDETDVTVIQHKKLNNKKEPENARSELVSAVDIESTSDSDDGSAESDNMQTIANQPQNEETGSSESEAETEDNAKTSNSEEEPNNVKPEKQDDYVDTPAKIIMSKLSPIEQQEWNSRTIYATNLPPRTKKSHMQKFFERYGKIQNLEVKGHTEDFKFVFVTFEEQKAAQQAAKEVNGMEYKQRRLKVVLKEPKSAPSTATIHISNLPSDSNRDKLWTTFETLWGPIKDFKLFFRSGRGFAWIEFEQANSKELAIQMKTVKIKDNVVEIIDGTQVPQKQNVARPYQRFTAHKPGVRKFGIRGRQGPRFFAGGNPGAIKVRKNSDDDSITITIGNNSFQAPGVDRKKF